jgi:hypothetical protein
MTDETDMKIVDGDLLSASSLLLAIIGVLYSVWYAEIRQARALDAGANIGITRRRVEEIGMILRSRALPLFLATLVVAAILAVPAYRVARGWVLSPHYDPIEACFIGVYVFLVGLLVLCAGPTWDLWQKRQEFRNEIRKHETARRSP